MSIGGRSRWIAATSLQEGFPMKASKFISTSSVATLLAVSTYSFSSFAQQGGAPADPQAAGDAH
jgi:hypothetical protein